MVNKGGVSAVVATVLIIMITVAAVGIIWAAIIPMVRDNLAVGDICKDVDISIVSSEGYTCYEPNNITIIQVKKGSANVNVSGLKFYLSALGNSVAYNKEVIFSANDYKVFPLDSSTISKLERIEVVPLVQSGDTNKACSPVYLDNIAICSAGSIVIDSSTGNGGGSSSGWHINPEDIISPTTSSGEVAPVDLIYPIFSNYLDNNVTLTVSGMGLFSANVDNTNGTVLLEINNTNITATNLSFNVYNVSYNFISNGTYYYRWHSWGNGTSKNYNISVMRDYVVDSAFAGGDGSPYNSYQISSWKQLNNVRNNLTASYILVKNLSSDDSDYMGLGSNWQPIGNCELDYVCSSGNAFTGSFDGKGNTISNLTINMPPKYGVGLFGKLGVNGLINNTGLVSVNVNGFRSVGSLVGHQSQDSEILNSYSTGNVTGSSFYVGGLVGDQYGFTTHRPNITDSFSSVNVVGPSYVGGLVGMSYESIVSNSYATGNVTCSGDYSGGLVGWSVNSIARITNSYATGNVWGNNYVGGLTSRINGGSIINSYATGNVNGSSTIGGMVGYLTSTGVSSGSIINSYATGNVNGISELGGLVGASYEGKINNSYATGNISGMYWSTGGLIGVQSGSTSLVTNSFSTGYIYIFSPDSYVGGLIGQKTNGVVSNNYWYNRSQGLGCYKNLAGSASNTGCTSKIDITYFYNSNNAPMNASLGTGWDFTNVWKVNSGSYPKLKWQD